MKLRFEEELESHSRRVADFSYSLAERIGLSKEERNNIYISALMHDIGKSYLDRNILNKPTFLTLEEKKHIQQHSVLGYLKAKELGYPNDIAESILFHHENVDGTGYPYNLTKNNIPISAKIIRICDVYDALTSDRVYREAFSKERALEIMKEEKNHFETGLYYSFIEIITENELNTPEDIIIDLKSVLFI